MQLDLDKLHKEMPLDIFKLFPSRLKDGTALYFQPHKDASMLPVCQRGNRLAIFWIEMKGMDWSMLHEFFHVQLESTMHDVGTCFATKPHEHLVLGGVYVYMFT